MMGKILKNRLLIAIFLNFLCLKEKGGGQRGSEYLLGMDYVPGVFTLIISFAFTAASGKVSIILALREMSSEMKKLA
jgi:hypothetical protein